MKTSYMLIAAVMALAAAYTDASGTLGSSVVAATAPSHVDSSAGSLMGPAEAANTDSNGPVKPGSIPTPTMGSTDPDGTKRPGTPTTGGGVGGGVAGGFESNGTDSASSSSSSTTATTTAPAGSTNSSSKSGTTTSSNSSTTAPAAAKSAAAGYSVTSVVTVVSIASTAAAFAW